MDCLEHRIWPAEARLAADDVYWGTRLACAEMIRTGTVRFWDMYWHPDAVARAVEDAGLRAVVGLPLVDGMDPARAKEVQADGESVLDLLGEFGSRVTPSLTPHGIYTVSEATLEWAASEAAARDLPIHLHFLEVEDEVRGCHERYGESPAALLDRVGALGARTVLAHAVWTEPSDRELIAERGATVVTNTVSNLKLAVGRIFPYAATRAAGIPVGLGTDGAASNNSLDLLADCKVLALLQKHAQDDPAALPADEAWSIATGGLAPYLGGTPVAAGQPADFVLVRADAMTLEPGHALANLVYAASGDVVDATVVDGRVLMRDATVDDAEEIVARVRECAQRLGVG
jgi:5-methylthioadenosine/S-adenosylhomocysteine deaminase